MAINEPLWNVCQTDNWVIMAIGFNAPFNWFFLNPYDPLQDECLVIQTDLLTAEESVTSFSAESRTVSENVHGNA
jgi:hypothetical protein